MIKGKQVGLRSIEQDDLRQLRDWRNNETFRRNFREVRELNMNNQENWFAKLNASSNDFMFIIERLEDKRPVGTCGLLYVNWIIRSADFSFYIGFEESYIDQAGYAKEAAALLISYGFNNLNLNKIWMELYEFDTSKLDFFLGEFGFKTDGKLRANCFEQGRFWDSYIVSLLKEDYRHLTQG